MSKGFTAEIQGLTEDKSAAGRGKMRILNENLRNVRSMANFVEIQVSAFFVHPCS